MTSPLPKTLEAELNKLGLLAPQIGTARQPRPPGPIWEPEYAGQEPPF